MSMPYGLIVLWPYGIMALVYGLSLIFVSFVSYPLVVLVLQHRALLLKRMAWVCGQYLESSPTIFLRF